MICLYCGKDLDIINEYFWHPKCIKKFFKSNKFPDFDFLNTDFDVYAKSLITKRESITGVQKKLSSSITYTTVNKKTVMNKEYIIKINTPEFENITIAEKLVMLMAAEIGIDVCECALIKHNDDYIYICERMDRADNNKIHMEDFCQLIGKPTEEKYHSSYEQCAKVIDKFSNNKKLDKVEFFLRVLFCFITGNSDMHLKNFSLMEDESIYLSKQYDLLPVNIIYPLDKEEMALTLNGKKKNITKNDIKKFGYNIGLEEIVINKLINKIISKNVLFINMIDKSLLPDVDKDKFKELLNERISRLM